MPYSFLSKRSLLALSGDDVIEFLQGLISNDARRLMRGENIYAALLSPQGKFLHDFFLIPWQGKIFLDVASARADDLLSRLKLYKLRSNVQIERDLSLVVAATWDIRGEPAESPEYKLYQDPRLTEMGFRIIGTEAAIRGLNNNNHPVNISEYETLRLTLAIPDSADLIFEKSLLLECGFEQLHGVDFSKGCYVGQEVTARSKFRGQVRKNFYSVRGDAPLPELGTLIFAGDQEGKKSIGEMRTSIKTISENMGENIGLAIINNDEYETAINAGIEFFSDGKKLQLTPTKWK